MRKVRKLGTPELVFLWLEKELHSDLTPAGRRKLYEAIKGATSSEAKVVVGPIEVPLKSALQNIRKRYRELKNLRSGIIEQPGKEPTIKGLGISVYLLAALAQGESPEEIIEDYPGVTRDLIDRAVAYAAAYPKKGRPYPTRSFKRMLADAGNAGVFDFEPAREEALVDSNA